MFGFKMMIWGFMKKNFNLFLAGIILLGIFSGCAKKTFNDGKINVVATIFPVYDWVKNVAGDSSGVNVELLVKNGVDLHSFQPSAADIIKISTADVLVFVGGESDSWVKDVLKNPANKNIAVINLMDLLKNSVKQEEFIEGMTAEKSENDFEEEIDAHNHNEVEYDEHVWLSAQNAKIATAKIAEILCGKDSENAELYTKNKNSYVQQLEQLKNFYNPQGEKNKTIIVCDRFPFRYMTDELGIKYFAAFVGCSAETEASFETIAFLSRKIQELGVQKVYVSESSDKKIAETVIRNAGQTGKCRIEVLDSMQSVTLEQSENGKNYIEVMKENYKKLSE